MGSSPSTGSPSTGFAPIRTSDCCLRRSPMPDVAIIGAGNIGSALARHFVRGGEAVVLAAKAESHPEALASELGQLARAASVEDAIRAADVVVFAVWLDTIRELIAQHAALLRGRS